MRLTYLAIPVVAVLLTACGDDERDSNIHDEPVPGVTEEYNEPARMPASPNNSTTTPPPTNDGTGLGTERGTDSGEMSDPSSGQGMGTSQ